MSVAAHDWYYSTIPVLWNRDLQGAGQSVLQVLQVVDVGGTGVFFLCVCRWAQVGTGGHILMCYPDEIWLVKDGSYHKSRQIDNSISGESRLAWIIALLLFFWP